jgi:hypothetical protein
MNRSEQEKDPYEDGCGTFCLVVFILILCVVAGLGFDAWVKGVFRISIIEQVGK